MTSQVYACWEFKPFAPSGGKAVHRFHAVRVPAAQGRQTTHRALGASGAPETSGEHKTFSGEAARDNTLQSTSSMFFFSSPHAPVTPTAGHACIHTPPSPLLFEPLPSPCKPTFSPPTLPELPQAFCPWTLDTISPHCPQENQFLSLM